MSGSSSSSTFQYASASRRARALSVHIVSPPVMNRIVAAGGHLVCPTSTEKRCDERPAVPAPDQVSRLQTSERTGHMYTSRGMTVRWAARHRGLLSVHSERIGEMIRVSPSRLNEDLRSDQPCSGHCSDAGTWISWAVPSRATGKRMVSRPICKLAGQVWSPFELLYSPSRSSEPSWARW